MNIYVKNWLVLMNILFDTDSCLFFFFVMNRNKTGDSLEYKYWIT